jgi:predicted phage tail protein
MFKRSNIMRKVILPILLIAFAGAAYGADPAPGQTINLKDGGKVVVQKGGTMVHMDAAGNRVKMTDGKVMETTDGNKIMMKNDALWQTISTKGTLHPNHH